MWLKYRNTKTGLLFFLLISAIFFGFLLLLFVVQNTSIKNEVESSISADIVVYSSDIDLKITQVALDVLLLEDLINNEEAIVTTPAGASFVSLDKETALVENLSDWITNRSYFDQIRIIDMTGMEIVRVNCVNNEPYVVPRSELQNKLDRYYFQHSVILEDDAIYMSEIDLNVENGVIELRNGEPVEMLRIASPIFDDNNQQIGIVIVNYMAQYLFHENELRDVHQFDVMNDEKYILHSITPEIEFGFMYPDKLDETYDKYFDYDLNDIPRGEVTQVDYKGDIYTAYKIDSNNLQETLLDLTDQDIAFVMEFGSLTVYSVAEYYSEPEFRTLLSTFLWIIFPLIVIAYFISKLIDEVRYVRVENLKVLKFSAQHDILTGLFNREEITKRVDYYISRNIPFTLLFLDLDKFKQVNDTLGHATGDDVLKDAANRISNAVRKTDTVARLGGDEFLILLDRLDDPKVVARVVSKIQEEVAKPYVYNNGTAIIGVSVGVAPYDGTMTSTEMITMADQLMYENKEQRKQKRDE